MSGTLAELLIAAVVFVGLHLSIPLPGVRARLIGRLGLGPYKGLFALQSVITLVWMFVAYAHAPHVIVWETQLWQLPAPLVTSFAGLLLVVASAGVANPTAGQPIEGDYAVRGVLKVTRNPQLWGLGLMFAGHLVPCGNVAALIVFAALSVLAFAGSFLLDHRLTVEDDPRWAPFAAVTSNIPFQAIAQGRQPLDLSFFKPKTFVVAFVVAVVLYALHPLIKAGYAML